MAGLARRVAQKTPRGEWEAEGPFKSVNELVTDTLREAILGGEFAEGESLRQQALAQRFGVSEVVIREALRRLEAEGLVESRRRRGARVTHLSVEEITELYELRILLERLITGHAVSKVTSSDLAAADELLQAMALERNPIKWLALNREFHNVLLAPSSKLRLIKFANDLRLMVERYLRMSLSVLQRYDIAHAEHTAILEAYRSRDVEQAVELVGVHLRRTAETVANFLRTHRRMPEMESAGGSRE